MGRGGVGMAGACGRRPRERRHRDRGAFPEGVYRTPGHPYTTAAFVLTCAAIVASTIASYPSDSVIGLCILLTGIPVYWYWSRRARTQPNS